MNDLTQTRVASVVSFLLGAWLLLSPIWISITGAALTSLMVTGAVIVVASAVQFFWRNPTPSWVIGIASIWLFASTLVYTVTDAVVWNQTASAIVAFMLSLWDGFEASQLQQHRTHTA